VQRIYAHCDSEGLDTNLQLYAIRQAAREWKNLCALRRRHDKNQVPEEKERLVFVLVCLGLSFSQLLGQQSSAKNLLPPKKLLDEVLSGSSVNETEQCQLRDKPALAQPDTASLAQAHQRDAQVEETLSNLRALLADMTADRDRWRDQADAWREQAQASQRQLTDQREQARWRVCAQCAGTVEAGLTATN
jgi:hypothetical protein